MNFDIRTAILGLAVGNLVLGLILQLFQFGAEIITQHKGKALKVTMSFGVATYPNHGKEAVEIIIKADKALYQSKHSGRNQVTAWSENQ